MFRIPRYRVVADLIHADGTFVTHTVASDIKDYDEVERSVAKLKRDPPSHFKTFSRVVPRWELSFA